MKYAFSVITPALNQGPFIEQNIQSVLRQSIGSFEHIIVDGGSHDETVTILQKYPHLKWTSEPDSGKTPALNKGFRMAQGEIIAWLNADDYLAEGSLQKVLDFFREHPGSYAVAGRAGVVSAEGKFLFSQREPLPGPITHERMIRFWRYGTLPQPSLFFKREVLEHIGFLNEECWSYMDYDFFLRLSRKYAIARLDEILSFIRSHDQADTCLNITSGVLFEALYRISRRYWGSRLSRGYWSRQLSYWLSLPKLRWTILYERFAYECRDYLETEFAKKEGLLTFAGKAFWCLRKYPLPFSVAVLRQILRKF